MMLGTVLATVNVSDVRCTPSAEAMAALRTKPRARDSVVPTAITELTPISPPTDCGGAGMATCSGAGAAARALLASASVPPAGGSVPRALPGAVLAPAERGWLGPPPATTPPGPPLPPRHP